VNSFNVLLTKSMVCMWRVAQVTTQITLRVVCTWL